MSAGCPKNTKKLLWFKYYGDHDWEQDRGRAHFCIGEPIITPSTRFCVLCRKKEYRNFTVIERHRNDWTPVVRWSEKWEEEYKPIYIKAE